MGTAMGWFPLGLGLVVEDGPSELSCMCITCLKPGLVCMCRHPCFLCDCDSATGIKPYCLSNYTAMIYNVILVTSDIHLRNLTASIVCTLCVQGYVYTALSQCRAWTCYNYTIYMVACSYCSEAVYSLQQ